MKTTPDFLLNILLAVAPLASKEFVLKGKGRKISTTLRLTFENKIA